MSTYERVTYHPEGGRRRTVLLGDVAEVGILLTGREVTEDGGYKWIAGGTTNRIHFICLELVDRRVPLRMDNTYGLLFDAALEDNGVA